MLKRGYSTIFFIIFIIFSVFTFAAPLEIKKIYSKDKEVIIEFSKNEKAQYKMNYDNKNQLIYLEIKNSKLVTKVDPKKIVNKSITDFKSIQSGNDIGIFIKQKERENFKILRSSNKIIVRFEKQSSKKNITIVIDPGHGGKDPGGMGNGLREKEIVLSVAKYLKDDLSKDFNIILTRERDNFITLSSRPMIANNRKADMFISLHVNASNDRKADGIDVFYFSKTSSPYAARIAKYENSFGDNFGEKTSSISQILGELEYKKYQELSAKLAKGMVNNLSREIQMKNRGIHGANFAVLRGLGRPSVAVPGVLVELGFVTNKNDALKLKKRSVHQKMAIALGEEVRKYFD